MNWNDERIERERMWQAEQARLAHQRHIQSLAVNAIVAACALATALVAIFGR